jgi:hypothetical protein
MAIVGLPAPIRISIPPALPTGGRTIIELRKYVNASYLNSRQLPGLCQPTSLIGAMVIGHWSLVRRLASFGVFSRQLAGRRT